MLRWSLQEAESDLQREAAFHAVASLLNKKAPGKFDAAPVPRNTDALADMASYLSNGPEAFWAENVTVSATATARRRNAITAWAWVRMIRYCFSHESCLSPPLQALEGSPCAQPRTSTTAYRQVVRPIR